MSSGSSPIAPATTDPAPIKTAAPAADAREVPDRTLVHGTFVEHPGQSFESRTVTGSGWLAHGPSGTTVTVELRGLTAGRWYMVHLGAHACQDGDNDTYTFPESAQRPAHQLHIMFAGSAKELTRVTDEDTSDTGTIVRSLVLLPASMEGRIACADLSAATTG